MLKPGRSKRPGFFIWHSEKRKEVAMKMLLVIMILRSIVAFLDTKRKNKNEVRNDEDNAMVQHPAAKLLR
jgi:hypothetical protein